MSAAAVIALLSEVIANLPAAITTGQQVIQLVNDGYRQLHEAIVDKEVTAEEINDLVGKIVANSTAIQAID
jgi:hypothetical protein